MPTSKLASQIAANKGKRRRERVGGLVVHSTGSSIVEQAKRAGANPLAFAVDFYVHGSAYPHYLIHHDGTIVSFCDEDLWSAHAAWTSAEKDLYAREVDDLDAPPWASWWIDTLGDGTQKSVMPSFYKSWFDRWNGRGVRYLTPLGLLEQIGGDLDGPNECTIGVEMLDAKPFTQAQHEALAALFADVCNRHELLDTRKIAPGTLPQAWLCTHSDVGPLRRWTTLKKGDLTQGRPWDPGETQLDWRLLERILIG